MLGKTGEIRFRQHGRLLPSVAGAVLWSPDSSDCGFVRNIVPQTTPNRRVAGTWSDATSQGLIVHCGRISDTFHKLIWKCCILCISILL